MCGIVAYMGLMNANEVVLKGLKRLEYRGYDSWGIAALKDSEIKIVKRTGKIGGISLETLNLENSDISIGHTRWATHGGVTEENAHPHLSQDNKIAVAHNGIIENYYELKEFLEENGFSFRSQTDTEVIPNLISYHMSNGENFESSFKKTLQKLEGSFAIVALNTGEKKILAARRASPLVIGIGQSGYFAASDVPAFLEYTNDVIFIDDNEMVKINDGIEIINFVTGKKAKKAIQKIDYRTEHTMKGNYEHFMLKEIHEQPAAIRETIKGRVKDKKAYFEDFKLNERYLKSIKSIKIVACGTSWHAGLTGKFMIEALGKIPVEVDYASEFRYRNPILDEATLVIAISQSGETADTLAAIREAKKRGAKVLSICNVKGSTITRESDETIFTRAGIEIGVASTKAFTSQLAVLYLFGVYLAQIREAWDKKHLEERIEFLEDIPSKMEIMLKESSDIISVAEKHFANTNALYLGRGTNYPIALEGALKLKEVSYLHAEGYPAAEMKHGPIALIDNRMLVVIIAVKDDSYEKIKGNIEEIKARGGIIITVATEGDNEIRKMSDKTFYVPKTSGLAYPFLTVIPLQLLAYYIARLRECDIDQPKNLAKSVTVE
jgi:glucosamine--fructose-6-phosphate aminotransferase (isomerizing)